MTDRRTVKLVTKAHRQRVIALVSAAPEGYLVTIQEPTRSLDQNAKMHAMLTDISRAEPLGRKHTAEEWKHVLMHACGWECQFAQGLDGRPFPVGFRSSKLTVKQMADLISYMQAFGDENGVRWSEPNPYGT